MSSGEKFVGGDQGYLRDVQYVNSERLRARAALHAKYGTAAAPWFRWLVSLVDWPASGDVLEAGCGPGWMWAEAAAVLPAGLRLTLTDLSPGMVREAHVRVSALERFAAVSAGVVDAQRLPFPDASFDVAVANHILYHVPDPTAAVAELARVIRPTGYLLAAANGPDNMKELWEIRSEIFGKGSMALLRLSALSRGGRSFRPASVKSSGIDTATSCGALSPRTSSPTSPRLRPAKTPPRNV